MKCSGISHQQNGIWSNCHIWLLMEFIGGEVGVEGQGDSTEVWNDWCELNAMRSFRGQVWDLLIEEWRNSERSTEELLLPSLVALTSSSTLILEGILANALTAEYVLRVGTILNDVWAVMHWMLTGLIVVIWHLMSRQLWIMRTELWEIVIRVELLQWQSRVYVIMFVFWPYHVVIIS